MHTISRDSHCAPRAESRHIHATETILSRKKPRQALKLLIVDAGIDCRCTGLQLRRRRAVVSCEKETAKSSNSINEKHYGFSEKLYLGDLEDRLDRDYSRTGKKISRDTTRSASLQQDIMVGTKPPI